MFGQRLCEQTDDDGGGDADEEEDECKVHVLDLHDEWSTVRHATVGWRIAELEYHSRHADHETDAKTGERALQVLCTVLSPRNVC